MLVFTCVGVRSRLCKVRYDVSKCWIGTRPLLHLGRPARTLLAPPSAKQSCSRVYADAVMQRHTLECYQLYRVFISVLLSFRPSCPLSVLMLSHVGTNITTFTRLSWCQQVPDMITSTGQVSIGLVALMICSLTASYPAVLEQVSHPLSSLLSWPDPRTSFPPLIL